MSLSLKRTTTSDIKRNTPHGVAPGRWRDELPVVRVLQGAQGGVRQAAGVGTVHPVHTKKTDICQQTANYTTNQATEVTVTHICYCEREASTKSRMTTSSSPTSLRFSPLGVGGVVEHVPRDVLHVAAHPVLADAGAVKQRRLSKKKETKSSKTRQGKITEHSDAH